MREPLSDREFTPPSDPGASGAPDASPDHPSDPAGDGSGVSAPDGERRRSRRGRRGGRRRRRVRDDAGPLDASGEERPFEPSSEEGADEVRESAEELPAALPSEGGEGSGEGSGEGPGERRRRRGRRGGRRRRGRGQGAAEGGSVGSELPPEAALEHEPSDDEATVAEAASPRPAQREREQPVGEDDGARRRRRRGSRGGRRRRGGQRPEGAVSIEVIPGEEDELPELAELPEDAVLVGSKGDRPGRGRAAKADPDADEDEDDEREPATPPAPHKKRLILVNARDSEEKRVAVVEDGRIVDLQMTVKKHVSYVNDIYRGRVVNIESAIGAAFVDFGEGKNGFLHASDVLPSYGEADWNLEKLLSTPVEQKDGRGGHAHESHAHADEHEHSHDHDHGHGESTAQGEAGHEHDEADADEHGSDEHGEAGAPADETEVHSSGEHGQGHEEDDFEAEEAEAPAKHGRGGRGERGRRGRPMPHRARVRIPIDKLLKKGQMVAVQITKDAIGDKGPTLTTYISIPGRYLVLMPSLERTGVSRKIDDEKERRRLKRILQSLDIPEGMGVIVRTAGVGRSKLEIKRDLDYLLLAWEDFSKRLRSGRNPSPLYQESDVAIRTMRDLFTPETESVFVDDPEVYQRVVEFTKRLMPEHLERVRMHEGERPLFHSHGVEQDFEKIFARRVELPSGGSIVIEQTEALVAIDVNSGRTREEGAEFEDIALKTNLEATPEIARQIRLRDLGGIIVLDYIDMIRAGSRRAVERATREALKADRARAKIGRISQFGLLELTRQRLGPGLSKLVYDPCPRCRGSGRRRNASSRAQAIMRRLAAALALKGYTTVEVRTHPDVIEYLETELKRDLAAMQEVGGREIKLLSVPEQVEDSVLHYLRADGREVRPGGRRRR